MELSDEACGPACKATAKVDSAMRHVCTTELQSGASYSAASFSLETMRHNETLESTAPCTAVTTCTWPHRMNSISTACSGSRMTCFEKDFRRELSWGSQDLQPPCASCVSPCWQRHRFPKLDVRISSTMSAPDAKKTKPAGAAPVVGEAPRAKSSATLLAATLSGGSVKAAVKTLAAGDPLQPDQAASCPT